MRVAMVGLRAPWGTEGGIEAAVGMLAPRLAARGLDVSVLCRPAYNPLGPGTFEGVRLIDVPTVRGKHLEAFVHTGAALPAAIARADVVHLHACGPALWAWLPRLAGRAVVVTVHGLDWQRDKWSAPARLALRAGAWSAGVFPHQVIAVGAHLQDWMQAHGRRAATFIPNGVEPIPAVPLHQAGVPGLRSGRFLLALGRLVPEKGLSLLIDAWRRSGTALPLVITGGDTYVEDHAAALRAGAPDGVHFTGPLYGPARDALLTHARALVSPSRLEGFPLSPLESLSAGRPVLLSDIAPHRELLGGGGGWLVPRESDAWARALSDLERRPDEEVDAEGRRGQHAVRAAYGWDAIAARTEGVYRQALAEQRGA